MKVRLEAKLTAHDGERTITRTIEMPAPPTLGLHVVGRGWDVEVVRLMFVPESGEYRATCSALVDESKPISDVVRIFEIEDWKSSSRA